MNDEIKEILDKWKCYIGLTKKFTTNEYEVLRVEDVDKTLDYITNLQQENERLKEELFKSVNNTNNSMELTENYKSRCEKAKNKLSFIDEALENDILNVPLCITKINSALNILQGENNGN